MHPSVDDLRERRHARILPAAPSRPRAEVPEVEAGIYAELAVRLVRPAAFRDEAQRIPVASRVDGESKRHVLVGNVRELVAGGQLESRRLRGSGQRRAQEDPCDQCC